MNTEIKAHSLSGGAGRKAPLTRRGPALRTRPSLGPPTASDQTSQQMPKNYQVHRTHQQPKLEEWLN